MALGSSRAARTGICGCGTRATERASLCSGGLVNWWTAFGTDGSYAIEAVVEGRFWWIESLVRFEFGRLDGLADIRRVEQLAPLEAVGASG